MTCVVSVANEQSLVHVGIRFSKMLILFRRKFKMSLLLVTLSVQSRIVIRIIFFSTVDEILQTAM